MSAALLSLSRLAAERRAPALCLRSGALWRALVALCVLRPEHADRLTSGHWRPAAGHSGPARVSGSDLSVCVSVSGFATYP